MTKHRLETNHDQWKNKARAELFRITLRASWDYPAGVEQALSSYFVKGATPLEAAVAIGLQYFPVEYTHWENMVTCRVCHGDGTLGEAICHDCKGRGRVHKTTEEAK